MLDSLRSSIRGPIALVFVVIIGGALSLFFVPELVRGLNQQGVATVGSRTISEFDMSTEFQQQVDFIAQQAGQPFTAEDGRAMGLPSQVLSDLVRRALIDQKAEDLGFGASDALVFEELEGFPAFLDPATGSFSPQQYARVLSNARISPTRFEEDLATQIRARPLADAIELGSTPPRLMVEPLIRYAREERRVTAVVIGANAASDPHEPSDDELREFYEQRRLDYESPERRDLLLVKLDVADLFDEVELSDDDVRMEFEVRRDSLEQPERRTLVELVARDADTANSAAERLRQGEEPDAVATDLGLPEPNRYDEVTRAEIFDPSAAETAFSLEEGAVSDPVEGSIAWTVWRAVSVTPGVSAVFEDMAGELRAEIAGVLASDILVDRLATFEDALAGGSTLEAAAEIAEIEAVAYQGLDREGFDADGARVVALAERPQILQRAFAVSPNFVTEIEELGREGFFALRVDAVTPAEFLPYEDVVDDVRFAWETRAIERSLDDLADRVRADMAEGTPAEDLTLPAETFRESLTVGRSETPPDGWSPILMGAVFRADIGEIAVGSTPDGGRVITRVETIIPAEEISVAELDMARVQLTAEFANDVSAMALAALQEEYPVRVNTDVLSRAVGEVRE